MIKKIRHASELPEWFDIEPYLKWSDAPLGDSAFAVRDSFRMWRLMAKVADKAAAGVHGGDRVLEVAMGVIPNVVRAPFSRIRLDIMREIHGEREKYELDEEQHREINELNEDMSRWEAVTQLAGKKAREVLGDEAWADPNGTIQHVTVMDAINFIRDHQSELDQIDRAAQQLADSEGWDVEEVREAMLLHIPMYADDGSSFIWVNETPTIETKTNEIKAYLRETYGHWGDSVTTRKSEVRKMFEYRAAAYADLQAWAALNGASITARRMSQTLFPDGRVTDLDMPPSRPIGKLYNRLSNDDDYFSELVRKASEMQSEGIQI